VVNRSADRVNAEARAVKFCTQRDNVKSSERNDKPPKGHVYVHVTHFCMHSCGL